VVEKGAHVGVGSRIDAGVVVGRGTHIGEYCHIYPNVVLYPGTTDLATSAIPPPEPTSSFRRRECSSLKTMWRSALTPPSTAAPCR
jgi:hypothetical protein